MPQNYTHICQIQTYTCILSATAHKKFALNERAVESGNNKKNARYAFHPINYATWKESFDRKKYNAYRRNCNCHQIIIPLFGKCL